MCIIDSKVYTENKESKVLLGNRVALDRKVTKEIPYGVASGATQTPTLKEILSIG